MAPSQVSKNLAKCLPFLGFLALSFVLLSLTVVDRVGAAAPFRTIRGQNYYQILGSAKTASEQELKTAYRQALMASHPDHGGTSEAVQNVLEAYEVLKDPVRRSAYDVWLGSSMSAADAARVRAAYGAYQAGAKTTQEFHEKEARADERKRDLDDLVSEIEVFLKNTRSLRSDLSRENSIDIAVDLIERASETMANGRGIGKWELVDLFRRHILNAIECALHTSESMWALAGGIFKILSADIKKYPPRPGAAESKRTLHALELELISQLMRTTDQERRYFLDEIYKDISGGKSFFEVIKPAEGCIANFSYQTSDSGGRRWQVPLIFKSVSP